MMLIHICANFFCELDFDLPYLFRLLVEKIELCIRDGPLFHLVRKPLFW